MTAAVVVVADGHLRIEASRDLDLLVLSADLRTGDGAYLSVRAPRGTTVVRPPLDSPDTAIEVVDAVTGVVYARLPHHGVTRCPGHCARGLPLP